MGEHHGSDDLDFEEFKQAMLKEKQIEGQNKEQLESDLQKKFDQLDKLKLGATGQFPHGKLTPKDEGEIKFSVGLSMDKKRVVINFGKAVRWVGMNRNQAIDVGKAIIKTAKDVVE